MAFIDVTLVVACAQVDGDKRVLLIAQRAEGKAPAGLWKFFGGKVEPSERPGKMTPPFGCSKSANVCRSARAELRARRRLVSSKLMSIVARG